MRKKTSSILLTGLLLMTDLPTTVVWIPDPELLVALGTDASDELNPTHTHSSMEDFRPEDWGLPPY